MKNYLLPAFAAILIVAGFAFWYRGYMPANSPAEQGTVPENPIVIDPNATSTTVDGYTIERVQENVETSYPSLTRALPASTNGMSDEAHAKILHSLSETVQKLGKNPNDTESWMILGTYRQILGDYEGAKEAWIFVAEKTQFAQAYENLGNLYAGYLKDAVKAEANYKKAIARDPIMPQYYRTLAEWYTNASRAADAENTLRTGIKAVPKALDLYVLLARQLVANDKTKEAKALYAQAIESAKAQNNTDAVVQITAEMNKL